MNKSLYFGLGLLLGAGAGSVGTYFLVKDKFEQEAAEMIDEYAEHCDERVERMREHYLGLDDIDEEKEDEETDTNVDDDPDERSIRNNEGVKKYHHYDGAELPEYASKRVFKAQQSDKERAEIKQEIEETKMVKSVPEVREIKEDDFLNMDSSMIEKQTIDVLFRYGEGAGKEEEIWGYQTDNECSCKERFGKGLIDLIGIDSEDMLDWVEPDEGIAVRYFLNNAEGIAFEIVVHCDPDTYYEKG